MGDTPLDVLLPGSRQSGVAPDKIELYDEGEYCEAVDENGDTCLDRCDNTQCNPCMRRIKNINSYK